MGPFLFRCEFVERTKIRPGRYFGRNFVLMTLTIQHAVPAVTHFPAADTTPLAVQKHFKAGVCPAD